MRVNLPVTQNEFEYPDGQSIVTLTDLRGNIQYCNRTFVEISGFDHHELLGQPQNIVRHPDMPREAFRDLWATIRAGRPWSAPVKNRRKNGDHYWVLANVTPVLDNGRPVGYLSVRTKPTRQQVADAERLYAQMRAQEQQGRQTISLDGGHVVYAGVAGLLHRIARPGLTARLGMTLASVGLICALLQQISGVLAIGGGLLAVIVGALWLRNSVSAPMRDFIDFANTMAAGDLTRRLNYARPDEFGELARALNQLNVNLYAVVTDVRFAIDSVKTTANDVAMGSQDLSNRTSSQAASLEQTTASMHRLVQTVHATAASANAAGSVAREATVIAQEGSAAVSRVANTMEEILAASKNISNITSAIDEIAFQTNILALNAAVEAARAGEQGRSFAVVAGEVRSLAQRSATAAREIKELIQSSSERVESGAVLVSQAGTTMNAIVAAVERMTRTISEISEASTEQLTGLSQVNQALTHIDSMTQQNAALVEESGAAAESLTGQALTLNDTVQIFRVNGSSSPIQYAPEVAPPELAYAEPQELRRSA